MRDICYFQNHLSSDSHSTIKALQTVFTQSAGLISAKNYLFSVVYGSAFADYIDFNLTRIFKL